MFRLKEIGGDPFADIFGFTDIQDIAGCIEIPVNTGLLRQVFTNGMELLCSHGAKVKIGGARES